MNYQRLFRSTMLLFIIALFFVMSFTKFSSARTDDGPAEGDIYFPISIGSANFKSLSSASIVSCPPNAIERFGVNVAREGGTIADYPVEQLNLGWYMDYRYQNSAGSPAGIDFARMIRSNFDTANLANQIGPIVDANPGSLWLAGNEPDRAGQDGVTAEEYAVFYHDVYTFIKGRDPSAQIAFAGLVTPTILRQKYLDKVVDEYQRLYGETPPADVVHVHGFVMSEKMDPSDSISFWGAGVPPGMSPTDPDALRLEPQQHWDLNIFQNNLISFRQWMANNGYRNKPLIVSEYGILLPDGWDLNGVGTANFMTSTFDFFLDQTNGSTGLGSDGNRLVQQFSWFSLNFPDDTQQGPLNGALFIPNTSTLTALGQAYKNYTNTLIQNCNIPPTAVLPTNTPVSQPNTPVPPTDTPAPDPTEIPPTDTPAPPPNTPVPPTNTPVPEPTEIPPTDTPVPQPNTPVPPTDTPAPDPTEVSPTDTPAIPTPTPTISSSTPEPTLCDGVSEIDPGECSALVSLYNSTNGAGWDNGTNWLQTTTPCSWFGVRCRGGHVIGLLLNNNDLNGMIPAAVGNLGQMEYLDLARNQLSGSLPSTLGNMSNLAELFIQENQLSGALPAEMGQMNSLMDLFIYGNPLSGALPTSLTNLANLERFSFHDTSLCEPPGPTFQTWLNGLNRLQRTGLLCN